MDEVFGEENFVSEITIQKTTAQASALLSNVTDYILFYCKNRGSAKFRPVFLEKELNGRGSGEYVWLRFPDGTERTTSTEERNGWTEIPADARVFRQDSMVAQGAGRSDPHVNAFGKIHHPGRTSHWKTHSSGVERLIKADRSLSSGRVFKYKRFIDDFRIFPISNIWGDTGTGGSSTDPRVYVVQNRHQSN
jgi:adenine-specific DNA-methyltransferase